MKHLKWLCLLCAVAMMLLPQLGWAEGQGGPAFKPTGEVSIGYWLADGQFDLVGGTWRAEADTDARPWLLRGEYRFAPRWSAEASVTTGDIRSGPWAAWALENPADRESGRCDGDLRMWALNVYYNAWRSPQTKYGRASTVDVGVGYQRFRETVALEHLLPPEVAGIVSTYRTTFKGLQLGVRGRAPLAKQVDLKAGLLWKPNEDVDLENYYPGGEDPGHSASGDGEGWCANLAVVYAPTPEWEVELGYRSLRHTGDVPGAYFSDLEATQKGFWVERKGFRVERNGFWVERRIRSCPLISEP